MNSILIKLFFNIFKYNYKKIFKKNYFIKNNINKSLLLLKI